jgi:RHH-type rel operon transcriptional repressor/antitoxin RelB
MTYRKEENNMSTAVSIRLPDIIAKELDHIAEETERPRSFHVQKALESYIDDFADVQIALDRLRDQKDPVVSSREMRKSLGL